MPTGLVILITESHFSLPVNESSVQCVTEADFGSPVLSPVNSLKAEFTSNSGKCNNTLTYLNPYCFSSRSSVTDLTECCSVVGEVILIDTTT